MRIFDIRGRFLSAMELPKPTFPCGSVQVGGRSYPNPWVPSGRIIRQVNCILCLDSGRIVDDDGEPTEEACDCWRGATW